MDIIEVDWISDEKQLLGGQVSGIEVIDDFQIGIWLSYPGINFSDKSIIADMKTKVGVISQVLNLKILEVDTKLCIGAGDTKFALQLTLLS